MMTGGSRHDSSGDSTRRVQTRVGVAGEPGQDGAADGPGQAGRAAVEPLAWVTVTWAVWAAMMVVVTAQLMAD
jgi:hypothetical protein